METGNWSHTAHLNLARKDGPGRKISDWLLGRKWAGDMWIADFGHGMRSRWCQGLAALRYHPQVSAVAAAAGCPQKLCL